MKRLVLLFAFIISSLSLKAQENMLGENYSFVYNYAQNHKNETDGIEIETDKDGSKQINYYFSDIPLKVAYGFDTKGECGWTLIGSTSNELIEKCLNRLLASRDFKQTATNRWVYKGSYGTEVWERQNKNGLVTLSGILYKL